MKKIVLFILWAVQCGVMAQGTMQTVVPFGYDDQRGNRGSLLLLAPETQDLFRGSSFVSIWTTPVAITGIAFRVTPGGGSFDVVMPSIEVRLSTSSRVPETMSQGYSLNKGPDETTVYRHSNVALVGRDTQTPNPFDVRLNFDQPFVYDPTKGSLLLDFRVGTPAPGGVSTIDSVLLPQLTGADAAYVQGFSVMPGSDIVQFEAASVPEPTPVWLGLLGTFGFLACHYHLKGEFRRVAA